MESKIIYHIQKFIAFIFGKENQNDQEQRIYNKLLHLEGDELETWINENLKKYIIFSGYYDFQWLEGINNPTRFEIWYTIYSLKKNSELMHYVELYDHSDPEYTRELQDITLKLHNFQQPIIRNYNSDLDWRLHIMTDYMEMFIMTMSSEDLKTYIIRHVDPVEIK